MKLLFSELAVDDLVKLRKFVADSAGDPQRVSKQLIGSIRKLLIAPQIGRWISELPGEIREMVFGKYVVRYAVINNRVYVLRIWHGKEHRSWAPDS
jgi:plasmid stabilization system protein ParE